MSNENVSRINEKVSTELDVLKRAMIEALEANLGIVTPAAAKIGIHRGTHYYWMKTDPDYAAAVDSVQDIALDFAESKLHEQIKEKDTIATIFYLKTKGKKRGYIEKQEIAVDATIRPMIVLNGPSEEAS
jgi:hypothetical protein